MDYDIIIAGGTIYDGLGGPGYKGDVGIKGDQIVAVGAVSGSAKRRIDAQGLAVCPGFIDPHSHYDGQVFWDPLLTCSSWHGVTTVVMGNCGVTFAPGNPENREMYKYMFSRVEGVPMALLEDELPWDWTTFGDFLDSVERLNPALNIIPLIGQSAVRATVMGEDAVTREVPTAAELEQMKDLVREGMAAGAAGLSVSRYPGHVGARGEPMPGKVCQFEELLELFDSVAESGRGFIEIALRFIAVEYDAVADREEDWSLIFDSARRTGLPVSWTPLVQRESEPEIWREFIERNEMGWREGLKLYPQTSPYTNPDFTFSLDNVASQFDDMPGWKDVMFKSRQERIKLYKYPSVRARLKYDMYDDPVPRFFHRNWNLVRIESVILDKNQTLIGRTVADLAKERQVDPLDFFLDLSLEEDMHTVFATGSINMDEAAALEIMTYPHGLVSLADGGAHIEYMSQTGYPSHILGSWVRERGALSLEKAIQIMTSLPAEAFGLEDRGVIATGCKADVVVFDPKTIMVYKEEPISDLPNGGTRMIQRGKGIAFTIVNGTVMMEAGKHTGAFPGRVIRDAGARVARSTVAVREAAIA